MTSGKYSEDSDSAPTLEVGSDKAFDDRIEEELERVNIAVNEIGQLSKQFHIVKASYKNLYERAKNKCDKMYSANKKEIEQTRPFFMAKADAIKAKDDFIAAASRYRTACIHFEESRENAATAEKAFLSQMSSISAGTQDPEVLVNLNKANENVYEAGRLKHQAHQEQQRKMYALSDTDHQVALLGSADSKAAIKAQPYYETRDNFQQQLDAEYIRLKEHHILLNQSKERYRSIFAKLHVISAEFEQREELTNVKRNYADLSKFEEIEDLQAETNFEREILESNYQLDVISSDSVASAATSIDIVPTEEIRRNPSVVIRTDLATTGSSETLSGKARPDVSPTCYDNVFTFSDNMLEDDISVADDYHGSLELQL